ncbi:histidine phosphatase family protein [Ferruginibacter sp.]
MKQYFLKAALLTTLIFFTCCATAQLLNKDAVLKVVIIRHGEKPKKGDNLSDTGLLRSMALPAVLDTVTGKPDYTYVPTMGMGTKTTSVRMFQLVTPFAVKENLTINSAYKEDSTTAAANNVLTRKGVVLMVWEHSNIPPLAKALVGSKLASIVPGWNGCDFESIWILEFKKGKSGLKLLSFNIEQENIFPNATCPKPPYQIYP